MKALLILLLTACVASASLPKDSGVINRDTNDHMSLEDQIDQRLSFFGDADNSYDDSYKNFVFVKPYNKGKIKFTPMLLTDAIPWFVPRKKDPISEVIKIINHKFPDDQVMLISDIKWTVVTKNGMDCLAISADVAFVHSFNIPMMP